MTRLRPPRRNRADLVWHCLRTSFLVGLRQCRQDSALQCADTGARHNGEVLIESHLMLDYLDSLVPADRRVFPATEPARHQALKVSALATGLGDKAVSLFYELRLHEKVSNLWIGRCRTPIEAVLACCRPIVRRGRHHTGSTAASVTPTSRLPRRSASSTRPIPGWFR